MGRGHVTLLVLFYASFAFDSVDHSMLLHSVLLLLFAYRTSLWRGLNPFYLIGSIVWFNLGHLHSVCLNGLLYMAVTLFLKYYRH